MDTCIYDSKLPEYKEPFGAVPSGQKVKFHVYLPKTVAPVKVSLVLHVDNMPDEEYEMELVHFTGNENIYGVDFLPERPKLYFYSFCYWDEWGCHTILSDAFKCGKVDKGGEFWQLTVYDRDMKAPGCFGTGIMYQIFPDRFCNSGEKKENIPAGRNLRSDWGALPVFRFSLPTPSC